MFCAKIQEGTIFRKLIESIKELVKLVNIDVSPQGLSIQAMDSSHVALVALNLKQKGFQEYRCDKPMTLGLSIQNVSKILKCAGSQDSITLQCNEEPQVLKFKFQSKKGDKISQFSLKLVTIDSELLGIPETQFSSICTLPSNEFARICKEFGGISQTIKIQTNKEHIKLSVNGELGDGNTILRAKEASKQEDSVTLQVDQPVNLSFSARYLNQFSKASAISSKVTLSMSAETPLLVEYQIESTQNRSNLGELRYYLAPKITEETQ